MRSEQFRDPSQPVEVRASDLLERMTLDEKLAQLGSVWSFDLLEEGRFSRERARKRIGDGISQISRPGGASGYEPEGLARFINDIQRFLVDETRLGIPAIMHDECLSGFLTRGAPLFPQAIGLASTWEPALVGRMTTVIRKQMRKVGVHQGLAPVLDIARDPRWGRTEETLGEDPYLVARMGTAYVKGLQGEELREGIIATVKHFVAYSASEGGLNWAPVYIPERVLREVFMVPFECAIREGGALSVMNSYSELDGIPCATSRRLLTEVLREEWGFEGIVVADYEAIIKVKDHHKVAKDKKEAAKLCLEAGLDVELPTTDCYGDPVKELIEQGALSEKTIDDAVRRILKVKLLLGLFENPYVDAGNAKHLRLPEHRELSLEIARKSVVLLKNDGLLPLTTDIRRIAVIGPSVDEPRNLLSDYAYPAHMELMFALGEVYKPPAVSLDVIRKSVHVTSPLEAVKKQVGPGTEILFAKGCDVTGDSNSGFAEAIETAKRSDVAIVVVGDRSGLTQDCTCGETRDLANLKLPGVQEELILAIAETGVPVVLVLASGRPYSLKHVVERVNAILEIWLPGETGGEAVSEVLFGACNPSGKLPISFPKSAGQIPVYYAHKPSGGRSQRWGDYVDETVGPLFPFGHGLSYTTFKYANLEVNPGAIPADGDVTVRIDVENTGELAGDEVVQLYVMREHASVTRPVKELKGFNRVSLKPGEKKTVVFVIPSDVLSFYGRNLDLVVEPGRYVIMIGSSSDDIRLLGEFEIRGEKRQVSGQRRYFTRVHEEG